MPDLGEDENVEPLRPVDWTPPEPIRHVWRAELGRRPTLSDWQHATSLAQGIGVPQDASVSPVRDRGVWEVRFLWETDPLEEEPPRSRTVELAGTIKQWVAARRAR
jgi:hypothetical protein